MGLAGDRPWPRPSRLQTGGYILAVEGAIPPLSAGACWAWTYNGQDVTFQEAVTTLAGRGRRILCVGPAPPGAACRRRRPTPPAVKGVRAVTGKIDDQHRRLPPIRTGSSGPWPRCCSAQPDPVGLPRPPQDAFQRPRSTSGARQGHGRRTPSGQDDRCLEELGCRGPEAFADVSRRNGTAGSTGASTPTPPATAARSPPFPGYRCSFQASYAGRIRLNKEDIMAVTKHLSTRSPGSKGTWRSR